MNNLSGKKFGKWTVIGLTEPSHSPGYRVRWNCICDCGTKRDVLAQNLLNGTSVSCGCASHRSRAFDIIGKKFGRLTPIKREDDFISASGKTKFPRWLCHCDCGRDTVVISVHLLHGRTKSCGCIQREHNWEPPNKSHNQSNSREYLAWQGMLNRCRNSNHVSFKHYGGRGISVCERWATSFEKFLKDMGPRPDGLSIDRINNDGNYEPSNCRWATRKEQAQNKRNRRK